MNTKNVNRRDFLKKSSAGALGAGLISNNAISGKSINEEPSNPMVKEYRILGRTGFKVSDISSGAPSSEAVLKALLDSGVNYIDTGEVYGNGNNERLIAKVMKDYDRSKIFISSKLYTKEKFESKEDVIERTNKCLERLETDYVDCMMIHSAENSQILKDEAFHAGMEQMKKEGKVHFVGVSCHGNNHLQSLDESLDKILLNAVNDGRFDVFLMGYNFFNADIAEKVLDACDQKGIGTTIMKSNPVALYMMMDQRITKMKEENKEINKYTLQFYEKFKVMTEKAREYFSEYGAVTDEELMAAAMKYVLSNEKAHTICYAFSNFSDIETILAFSGQRLSRNEDTTLKNFKSSFGHLTCRIGCSDCEPACPHHLPINKIMRYNYYFAKKKQEKEAMELYAGLNTKKPDEVCIDCEGYCERACPHGVMVRPVLAAAHHNMSLMA